MPYTTKVNAAKTEAVDQIKNWFAESQDYIFTDYRGLTVQQITELRTKLRQNSADYRVVKNRFAKIALSQLGFPEVDAYLSGPTAVALASDDSGQVAKQLLEAGEEWPVVVKGAIISGGVFDAEQVKAYSKLPGRNELIAMLMGTMNAPLQNLAYAINGVTTKLVRTLQAVADKKAEG